LWITPSLRKSPYDLLSPSSLLLQIRVRLAVVDSNEDAAFDREGDLVVRRRRRNARFILYLCGYENQVHAVGSQNVAVGSQNDLRASSGRHATGLTDGLSAAIANGFQQTFLEVHLLRQMQRLCAGQRADAKAAAVKKQFDRLAVRNPRSR